MSAIQIVLDPFCLRSSRRSARQNSIRSRFNLVLGLPFAQHIAVIASERIAMDFLIDVFTHETHATIA